MILILSKKANPIDIEHLVSRLEWMGMRVNPFEKEGKMHLAVVHGVDKSVDIQKFTSLPFIDEAKPFTQPYKLVSKQLKDEPTIISVRDRLIGGEEITVIAGPCSIESEEQIFETASIVSKSGAQILRGGAFKPRTSPYSFQGLGEQGLYFLQQAGKHFDLLTISEVMDSDQIDLVAQYIDILQIGARNMQNFSLLKKLGTVRNPILLKRGLSATYQDLLMAAEYIIAAGNPHVILCERGIRTFETYSRNTLDIAAVPILHELTHLPIIIDPSHGTGIRKMVAPMARAAVAAGAEGIMVEVHPEPDKALSDAEQTLDAQMFDALMHSLPPIAEAVGRKMPACLQSSTSIEEESIG